MFEVGNNISIELETVTAPFRIHGTFQMQDDEFIKVRGTVGDDIGKAILVPKSRIKTVTVY